MSYPTVTSDNIISGLIKNGGFLILPSSQGGTTRCTVTLIE